MSDEPSSGARAAPSPAPAQSSADMLRALGGLAAGVRALANLARSSALPPAERVDEAEKTAGRHLEELRVLLTGDPPGGPSETAVAAAAETERGPAEAAVAAPVETTPAQAETDVAESAESATVSASAA